MTNYIPSLTIIGSKMMVVIATMTMMSPFPCLFNPILCTPFPVDFDPILEYNKSSEGGLVMAKYRWRVNIIESERGWGQKVEDVKFFDDEQSAIDFVTNFNKDNNLDYVPDWYMFADEPKKVMVDN
jgi:hypothetical protein